jgi:hypothetical protein
MDIKTFEIQEVIKKLTNNIRAENIDGNSFLSIYADETNITNIDNNNNQIIYGRRGSGKTHLLLALREKINTSFSENRRLAIYKDCRQLLPYLGKGIVDPELNATIIFQMIVQEIIDSFCINIRLILEKEDIFGKIDAGDNLKITQLKALLSNINLSLQGKTIAKLGDITFTREEQSTTSGNGKIASAPELSFGKSAATKESSTANSIKYISFGDISTTLREITELVQLERTIFLLDEWSEIPTDTQKHLSEQIKRAFIAEKFTFKIAAIPSRTSLGHKTSEKFYGLEDGGDIFGYQLDNRYIFETNKVETRNFFNDLLYKHLAAIDSGKITTLLKDSKSTNEKFINLFLTNKALGELCIASAGIPRDFINLLLHAYDKFLLVKAKHISVRNIRMATSEWYETDKKKQVDDHAIEKKLLEAITQEIIIKKRSTHFMIAEKNSGNKHIQSLIDFRVLHLRKRGYSHKDILGETFNVYSIDYGCYNHLSFTRSKLDTDVLTNLNVHENIREIRRIYLDDKFFEAFSLEVGESFNCPSCKKPIDTNHLAFKKQSLCNHCYEHVPAIKSTNTGSNLENGVKS